MVLHKLSHLINDLGREAYLFPYVDNFEINKFNYKKVLVKFFKKHLREPFRKLKTNPAFNTPVLKNLPKDINSSNWIVVYPEIIFGNPIGAKNVVRWLLHNPGHDPQSGAENKPYFYGKNELYFRNGNWFKEFHHPGSKTSKNFLNIYHFPSDIFNQNDALTDRCGTAYAIRKGVNKKICHNLEDSVLIDNLKQEEIAKIFKRVKTFISYDSKTNFSYFAALCGCDSVVIPDDQVSEEEWYPNEQDRYGVAYGFENISKARKTRSLLEERLKTFDFNSRKCVEDFIKEADEYFITMSP